jgi:hypothetical protein
VFLTLRAEHATGLARVADNIMLHEVELVARIREGDCCIQVGAAEKLRDTKGNKQNPPDAEKGRSHER